MAVMTKEEVRYATNIWAANAKSPIDRDTQVILMATARQRHDDKINRIMKQLEEERKGQ